MKSYEETANENGFTVDQVKTAMACVEKTRDTFHGLYGKYFVCVVGYGDYNDRVSHAEGMGPTREAAVIDALKNHPERF